MLPHTHGAQDNGVSVRKRAVRTLWECCARCPGFTRKTDAVVAILQRCAGLGQAAQAVLLIAARAQAVLCGA